MSSPYSPKQLKSPRSRRRTVLGVTIALALVGVAAVVSIFVVVKGVEASLSLIFSAICFSIILVLYWSRSEKNNTNTIEIKK